MNASSRKYRVTIAYCHHKLQRQIDALTACRAFFDNWVSRYGASETLTVDRGSQFKSQLFAALSQLIGCNRVRTTAYNPASNGMIERWLATYK